MKNIIEIQPLAKNKYGLYIDILEQFCNSQMNAAMLPCDSVRHAISVYKALHMDIKRLYPDEVRIIRYHASIYLIRKNRISYNEDTMKEECSC